MNITRNFLLEKIRSYQLGNFITLTGIKDQKNQKVFTRISNNVFLTGITNTALRNIFSV